MIVHHFIWICPWSYQEPYRLYPFSTSIDLSAFSWFLSMSEFVSDYHCISISICTGEIGENAHIKNQQMWILHDYKLDIFEVNFFYSFELLMSSTS